MIFHVSANKSFPRFVLVTVACWLAGLISKSPLIAVFLLLAIMLFILGVFFPRKFIYLLLLIRPSVDLWADKTWFSEGIYARININSGLAMLIIFVTIIAVLNRLAIKKPLLITKAPLFFPFLCFITYSAFVSFSLASDIMLALSECLRLFTLLCFYLLCFLFLDSESCVKKFLIAFISSAMIPLIFAIFQYITGEGIVVHLGVFRRVVGTFLNPPSFSHYLAFISLLLLIIWNYQQTWRNNIAILLILSLFCLVVTYGRGAWLGFSAGFFTYLSMSKDYSVKVKSILLLCLAILLTFFYLPNFELLFQLTLNIHDVQMSSVAIRLLFWELLLPLFYQNPVFGIGLRQQYALFYFVPHNDYLRLLIETGIIGIILYFWVITLMLYHAYSFSKNLKNASLYKTLSISFLAIYVCHLVISFGDSLLTTLVLQYPIWGLAALIHRYKVVLADEDFNR